jgi:hypothetical protein
LIKDGHVFTIQGHPEFFADLIQTIIIKRADLLTPEFVTQSMKDAELEHDGEWLGRKIVEFIMNGEVEPEFVENHCS